MRFLVEIELGNDAMMEPKNVSDALRFVCECLDEDEGTVEKFKCSIMDMNGNKVGKAKVVA